MLRAFEFLPTLTVTVTAQPTGYPASIEAEVERIWQAEQQRRGRPLFNGNLVSAVEVSSNQVVGRFTEYRYLIAQRSRPELFDVLQVRPVAVSGLFECADGIVFGRRADNVTQAAGCWELVPSGGLAQTDYRLQVLAELREEIGIGAEFVLGIRPFCIVEETDSHGVDIGISIKSTLSSDEVRNAHRKAGSKEYDHLRIVPEDELERFVEVEAEQLVNVSRKLIQLLRD